MSFRNQSHIMLGVLTALGLVVSVACGSAANHPPMATVAPPDLVAQAPVVTPTATVAPAAAVAPAHAPAAGFVMPTPRPTRTPMPRTEGDMTQPILYGHTATLLEDGRPLVADRPDVRAARQSRSSPVRERERVGLRRIGR